MVLQWRPTLANLIRFWHSEQMLQPSPQWFAARNCRYVALDSGRNRLKCACFGGKPKNATACIWRQHHGFDDKHGKGYYRREGFDSIDPLLL